MENAKVTVTAGSGKALLRVTLIRTDGGEVTASRVVEKPSYTVSEDGTYTVYNAEGLLKWAEAVQTNLSTSCTLATDIDMTGQKWIRVGESGSYFSGTFDGRGHTISNLKSDYSLISGAKKATIQNVTLVSPKISVGDDEKFAGGILRYSDGDVTLLNCHVVGGNITGSSNGAGGIVGYNVSDIEIYACSSTANVGDKNCTSVGGIIGGGIVNMVACYYAGGELTGKTNVGGIMGNRASGNISVCYWSGGTEKGIGNKDSFEGVTKVADGDWSEEMDAMNKALSDAGYSQYKWVKNKGDGKDSRPLVIEMQPQTQP